MFPPVKEVTGSNMNYFVAAFAIVFIVSVIQWFVDGRKNYSGPRLDVEALKRGSIVGMAPVESNSMLQAENGVADTSEKRADQELLSVFMLIRCTRTAFKLVSSYLVLDTRYEPSN